MAKYKIIPSSRTIVQSPISIGHKAEKGVEAIEFDLTAWVETYGSGTLTVIMRRWGDAIPYPIALEIDENNKATWTLSDTDTAKAGMAYAQLSYVVGETVVKKSDIYTFRVMDSLTGEGEPPEAYESWLEHLTHLAAEAMAEVLDIEGIVTDKTLTVDGGIADGKATGDALALKADKSTTYTKTEVDQMIEDVEVETDTTLSVSGKPADAKKTGDEISQIKADLDNLEDAIGNVGLSNSVKDALLTCFDAVAYSGNLAQSYYDALENALYPPATLVRITATYTQSGAVHDTDTLDSLKSDLVVTAHMSNGTTRIVTTYTLSGTLAEGTSVVTVTYDNKTTTFNVTVTARGLPSGYTKYDYITYDYALGTINIYNAIVTDVAMSSDYILDTEFSFTNDGSGTVSATECIMGSRSGTNGAKQFALFANRTTLKCGYWYGGTDTPQEFNYSQGVVNHVTVQPVGVSETYPNNATIKINGTEYNTEATATGVTWSPWLGFFGYGTAENAAGKYTNKYQLKLGRTIIKDLNGNALYDFIPVHNGTNYGLYEQINEKFYMGQEPSHFTCGNRS